MSGLPSLSDLELFGDGDDQRADAGDAAPTGRHRPGDAAADRDADEVQPDATDAAGRGALVEATDVSVAYGEVGVLEDVSLSVSAGEFVGLVGPNGAGKTTFLKAINGVAAPDSGTIRVAGADVSELSARATGRRVATVPQDTTVSFEFAVEDIVEMGRTPYHGRLAGDPDGAEAVERALDRTETARFRDRSVGSLSGGERQRVVLARALAQETPALLLDEPTASLDVNHQVRTLDLVRQLVDEADKAALAAIHDLNLAARFCDRLAVLSAGELLAVGPPDEVLTADHLATAFDAEAAVLGNPATGTPAVTPLSSTGDLDARVHVAGTGAAAARTLVALDAAGATVTAGVLPAGDIAAETARDLGIDPLIAPPFAPVDAADEAAAREELAAADAAVLAGSVPSSVRALVRDHDAVVRVAAEEGTESGREGDPERPPVDGDGHAVDPVATATPETVVDAVERVRDAE